jgi:hypothetical protein
LNLASVFQLVNEYKTILAGVKGDSNAKRLASQFIARFFANFPDFANESQVSLVIVSYFNIY